MSGLAKSAHVPLINLINLIKGGGSVQAFQAIAASGWRACQPARARLAGSISSIT